MLGSEADIGDIDELTEALNDAYERLEELDADTKKHAQRLSSRDWVSQAATRHDDQRLL